MKRIILTVIFLVTIFPFLLSQQTDAGANVIMDKLSKKYQQYSSMKINYTFKIEKDKKVLGSEEGILTIQGSKYRLEMTSQFIFCDAKTIWNYQKESDEISIFDFDPDDQDNLMNPSVLLFNWQKDYTAKFIREEFEQNKTLQIIDLRPIKSFSHYKIRLFIDKHKSEIYAFSVYEKDNTIYSYYINKFITNKTFDDAFFVLDVSKYKEAEIIDMR